MMRVLGNVMPVGGKGAGPESFRYPSCFGSLVMYTEEYDASKPHVCYGEMSECTDCGWCGMSDSMLKRHSELYKVYLAVSGMGLGTVWSAGLEPGSQNSSIPCGEDDYIRWSMQYAGYEYAVTAKDGASSNRAEMTDSIVHSVDSDPPVLAYGVAGTEWSLVTGYDGRGDTLIGWYEDWYGREWEPPESRPDEYLDNGMFRKTNWYGTASRVVVVNGAPTPRIRRNEALGVERTTEPCVPYSEVIAHLVAILEKEQSLGCAVGFRAYDECLRLLADDGRFASADAETLGRMYEYVHRFIGSLAEARCFAFEVFTSGFFGGVDDGDLLRRLREIQGHPMATHDRCWDAWRTMGEGHVCEAEKYAEGFRRPYVRREVAGHIAAMAGHGRSTLRGLQGCLELRL